MTTAPAERFALRLHKVSKAFGGVQALNQIDFEVRAGEVHCLAGENGCGKSTLIKVVTGVHQPESADLIELFGVRVDRITPVQARQRGVSVIWQDLALFPHMSVAENIAFDDLVGLRPRSVRYREMSARAGEVLERLGVSLPLTAPLNDLSIAQRQVVAIARALMNDAKLIFMDEPTASLTQSETDRLLDIVRTTYERAVRSVPLPAARRHKAVARADGMFWGLARRHLRDALGAARLDSKEEQHDD